MSKRTETRQEKGRVDERVGTRGRRENSTKRLPSIRHSCLFGGCTNVIMVRTRKEGKGRERERESGESMSGVEAREGRQGRKRKDEGKKG